MKLKQCFFALVALLLGFVLNASANDTMQGADGFVAKTGDATYETFNSALTAANVTVEGAGLAGAGTEADPYVINNLEDLKLFRDNVNSGDKKYNAKNVVVKLNADIDLNNEDWSPIGYYTTSVNNKFVGVFDGGGHTISNLRCLFDTESVQRAALFGEAQNATIKNVTVNNVNCSGLARVAGIVGGATTVTISNCHVTGDINLKGYQYVGAIVGYGYVKIDNCSVIASADNYADYTTSEGNGYGKMYMGGIVGWMGEGNSSCSNVTVKYVNLTTNQNVGAISGLGHYGNSFSNCKAEYVNVNGNSIDTDREGTVAILIGGCAGTADNPVTIIGCTYENVVVKDNGTPVTSISGQSPTGQLNEGVTNFVAEINGTMYESLSAAVSAVKEGETITIVRAGTYGAGEIPTKNCTVNAAVNGVVFDNIGAKNMGGASVTFNNVTFDYYPNTDYTGLQHSGNLVYNNCTFEGQPFLYGQSEVFNNCTFNQNSSNAYNVWTYGAKKVEFNNCVFNSAGKSVLIYNEGPATFVSDVTVSACEFNATSVVAGKAAIELDTSLNGGSNLTITNSTATGFDNGSVSGNPLWNNKKGNADAANNDITISVDNQIVLKPVVTGLAGTGTAADPFIINDIEELVWFRDNVNGGNNYKGKYIKVTAAEIDLNSEEWTPIGKSDAKFNGYFDGNGVTVKNLVINGGTGSNIGFFGVTHDGEIKNLTICNANVSGRLNVGVVAGQPYTSKYTDITVTGCVKVKGLAYVGGVGGKNAYADWTNITVDADENSFVEANSIEDGNAYRTYVGGVIGFIGEGSHKFTNIRSNIKVIGNVQDIGGLFGIAHYGNNFENVTFTGTVEAPEGATEVAGIAGVWHNQIGQTVTFTNVTSTGSVTVGAETTTGSVVGGAYNPSNETAETSGSLIVDGKEMWLAPAKIGDTKYETVAAALKAVSGTATVTILADVTLEEAVTLNGVTLTIDGDKTLTIDDDAAALIFEGTSTLVSSNISGTVYAANGAVIKDWNTTASLFAYMQGGTLTFAGENVIGSFNPYGYGNTINIPAGAYLKVSTDRMTMSYGNVFNITGTDDDKNNKKASLDIAGGMSFAGNGSEAQFNITNAYAAFGSSTSKNSNATGEFNFTFTNSVVDFTNNFATYASTKDGLAPVFNINIINSTVNNASHMELWHTGTNLTVDNSALNIGGSFAIAGTANIQNEGKIDVANPIMSSHGGNTGTINIENGTLDLTGGNQAWVSSGTINLTESSKLLLGMFSNTGTINVTVSDAASAGTYVVVDDDDAAGTTLGAVVVTGAESYTTENGDVVITVAEKVASAKIGDTKYETFADAVSAAQSGETIELIWKEGDAPIAMNAAVFGKDITVTGTAEVDWSKGWLFVGRGGEGNGKLTFDNATLTSSEKSLKNGSYGIHVSMTEYGDAKKCDGEVVFKNSKIDLSYLMNKNATTVDGGELTVWYGFAVGARPAKETNNEQRTATMNVINGATVTVKNHNGMGVGYESNGILNIESGSALILDNPLAIKANSSLVSAGDVTGTFTVAEGATAEISGGTYTMNVSDYCIDGYVALSDLNGNYVVGKAPTATVNNLGAMTISEYTPYGGSIEGDLPLSFVMQFLADQTAEDVATSPYADWYGDFVLTFEGLAGDSFTADGCYLAGYYGAFGWVVIPVDGMVIENGARYPVMLGVGMGQKYDYICSDVQDFRCALYITPEILEANPDINVKLELSLVDNSQGSDAATEALMNRENIYEVNSMDFDADYFAGDRTFDIVDDEMESYDNDKDVEYETITYTRTLVAGIWNALYLPFDVPVEELVENYDIACFNAMHSYDNDDNGVIDEMEMEIFKIKSGTLNANYPYFIRPKTEDDVNLYIEVENATLYKAEEISVSNSSVFGNCTLSGTYTKISAEDLADSYTIITDGTWGTMVSGSLKPFRLYLTITDSSGSPVKLEGQALTSIRFSVIGEDGTTDIRDIEVENNAENVIYDLKGNRVIKPGKGVYIVNGKKVIF